MRFSSFGGNVNRLEKTSALGKLNASALLRDTAATYPGLLLVVMLTTHESATTHSNSLSAVAVEETTQTTTRVVRNGKRLSWRLLSWRCRTQ